MFLFSDNIILAHRLLQYVSITCLTKQIHDSTVNPSVILLQYSPAYYSLYLFWEANSDD